MPRELGDRQLARGGRAGCGCARAGAHDSSFESRGTLSIRRVVPTRTAAARMGGSNGATATYSTSSPPTPGSRGPSRDRRSRARAAARAPGRAPPARGGRCATRARARRRRARSARRAARARGARSATIRRSTATCCASFWPKKARSGRTIVNSLRQTVATPRKWPGRCSPSSDRAELGHLDPGLVAGRVHLGGGRREDDVDARLACGFEVALPRRAGSRSGRPARRTAPG